MHKRTAQIEMGFDTYTIWDIVFEPANQLSVTKNRRCLYNDAMAWKEKSWNNSLVVWWLTITIGTIEFRKWQAKKKTYTPSKPLNRFKFNFVEC